MTVTREMVQNAHDVITHVQAEVFFDKLASLGITPQNEQQTHQLWAMGDRIVTQTPRISEAGQRIKQASVDLLGSHAVTCGSDGHSQEARAIADRLCQNPEVIKAAHLVMAARNL